MLSEHSSVKEKLHEKIIIVIVRWVELALRKAMCICWKLGEAKLNCKAYQKALLDYFKRFLSIPRGWKEAIST